MRKYMPERRLDEAIYKLCLQHWWALVRGSPGQLQGHEASTQAGRTARCSVTLQQHATGGRMAWGWRGIQK